MLMTVEEGMSAEVAKALLAHKRTLSDSQWQALKTAYRRARGSFAAPIALRIAEDAVLGSFLKQGFRPGFFRKPSQRPPV